MKLRKTSATRELKSTFAESSCQATWTDCSLFFIPPARLNEIVPSLWIRVWKQTLNSTYHATNLCTLKTTQLVFVFIHFAQCLSSMFFTFLSSYIIMLCSINGYCWSFPFSPCCSTWPNPTSTGLIRVPPYTRGEMLILQTTRRPLNALHPRPLRRLIQNALRPWSTHSLVYPGWMALHCDRHPTKYYCVYYTG